MLGGGALHGSALGLQPSQAVDVGAGERVHGQAGELGRNLPNGAPLGGPAHRGRAPSPGRRRSPHSGDVHG